MKNGKTCIAAALVAAAASATAADVNLLVTSVQGGLDVDGRLFDPAYKSAEWSTPVLVLAKESQTVNGIFEEAETKFRRCQSTAALFSDGTNLYVSIKSPVPVGMTPFVGKREVYNDDSVEFAVMPDPDNVYQIDVNSVGRWSAIRFDAHSASRKDWDAEKSGVLAAAVCTDGGFDVEIRMPFASMGVAAPSDGAVWRGNVARVGATCGGRASWAPVGQRFFAPAAFGKFIFADRRAYWTAEIAKLESEVPEKARQSAAFRAAVEGARKTIARSGATAEGWSAVLGEIRKARAEAVREVSGGARAIFWQGDVWRDFEPDLELPFISSGIEEIAMEGPQGARAVGSFLASNLSDMPAMFNLVVDTKDEELAKTLRFRRSEFVELTGGRRIPDAIFDLPIGAVLEIPPRTTHIVWVDADCSRLKPGVHTASVRAVASYSGFKDVRLAVRLAVGRADIREVVQPTWTYTIRWPNDIRGFREYDFNTACLLPFMYFGKEDGKGGVEYPVVDEIVQAFNANGVPTGRVNFLLYAEWPRWANFKSQDGRKKYVYMTPEWKEEYARRLRNFVAYARERHGIGYDRLAVYTNDEPAGDPDDPKSSAWHAIHGAEFVHSVDPKLRTFCDPWICEPAYARRYLDNFDLLEPCLPRLKGQKATLGLFCAEGRKMCSYSVLTKETMPIFYRRMHWDHLQLGFEGWAAFYDLTDACGDPFNSYDKRGRVLDDYAAAYRNVRTGQVAPSRRLEAWYKGLTELKLAKWCRNRIAAMKKKDVDIAAYERELSDIIDEVSVREGDASAGAQRLFALSERIANQ